MEIIDIYRPEQWKEFFHLVGDGAVTLTGLVFVAMSINLKETTKDPTHRYRAIGTLTGLSAVFVRCALALLGGQSHTALGIEWLAVTSVAALIFINGYFQANKSGSSSSNPRLHRTIGGSICYLTEIVGMLIFISGSIAGLYIAAAAMIANFYFMISGAWLLLIGIYEEKIGASKRG